MLNLQTGFAGSVRSLKPSRTIWNMNHQKRFVPEPTPLTTVPTMLNDPENSVFNVQELLLALLFTNRT